MSVEELLEHPKEGVKYDQTKTRLELIPPELIWGVGQALSYGASKYGARNIERGMDWDRVFGALQRHAWAWYNGEELDPESGLPHTYHVATNAAFLIMFQERGVGKDNRPKRKG